MDKRGGDGSSCFVVQEVTNTTEVTYVVVTETREFGDLLAKGEELTTKTRLRADEQGRIG